MPKTISLSLLAALPIVLVGSAVSAEPFELSAYEAPGMLPFPGEIIVRDARTRVPAAARTCGITAIRTVDATDGVVLFHFDASAEERRCLERTLPKGTQLRSLAKWGQPARRADQR